MYSLFQGCRVPSSSDLPESEVCEVLVLSLWLELEDARERGMLSNRVWRVDQAFTAVHHTGDINALKLPSARDKARVSAFGGQFVN